MLTANFPAQLCMQEVFRLPISFDLERPWSGTSCRFSVAWNWASDERRELRARLGDLKEVDRRDDNPFISAANPLVDREDDENADEGMTDMSICTEDSLNSNPLVEEASKLMASCFEQSRNKVVEEH
ncbi:hypothetical protein DFH09DRAFT_1068821 [Mycena vulgaris]|nr:hypothetical protein DFH09DRAFT_1068821 [Mycena vulgaris]